MASPRLYRDLEYDEDFFCQGCQRPLALEPCRTKKKEDEDENPEGFCFLSETVGQVPSCSSPIRPKSLDNMKDSTELVEEPAANSPACEICLDVYTDDIDKKIKKAEEECRHYEEFLEQLPQEDKLEEFKELLQNEDGEKLMQLKLVRCQSMLREFKSVQLELLKEKSSQDSHCENAKQILDGLVRTHARLLEEERSISRKSMALQRDLMLCEDDLRSSENKVHQSTKKLADLKDSDIFKVVFIIYVDQPIGIINNFRLGTLPNDCVPWSEINLAWGQIALLLYSLQRKADISISKGKIVPKGGFSYIVTKEGVKLPLYFRSGCTSADDPDFDKALLTFLLYFQEFCDAVKVKYPKFALLYKMGQGKIYDRHAGYSVCRRFNTDENWTLALKYMLSNLERVEILLSQS